MAWGGGCVSSDPQVTKPISIITSDGSLDSNRRGVMRHHDSPFRDNLITHQAENGNPRGLVPHIKLVRIVVVVVVVE